MRSRRVARRAARRGLPLALLLGVVAGPILDAGFPDQGIWPLAFLGSAAILLALRGRTFWQGTAVGFLAGLSFYLLHIQWATLFLGPIPWVALSVLESLFFAVGGGLIALAYRWLPEVWPSRFGRAGLLPVVVAGLWTAREAIASVWPYGGFAWGRLALSQSESPFSRLFGWLGSSGVSFVMVLLVAFLIQLTLEPVGRRTGRVLTAVAAVALVLAVPAWPAPVTGTMKVAAVQGNTRSAYFDQRGYQGEILDGTISATLPIIGSKPDVVVWPEGASDLDPLNSAAGAEAISLVSEAAGAPLIFGAITQRDGKYFNSSLLWTPGQGITDIYDKIHPVPFGEYVPDRKFWEPFAPDLIGMIAREYTPGTRDSILRVGSVPVGVNICFDVADDQVITDSVLQGAQILFSQSNNADFGRTDESVQQLAIARIRAMETGRSMVNISTVGTSAIIRPDGSTLDQLPWYTAAAMVQNVPLATALTPATMLGRELEWLVSGLGLGGLILAGLLRRGNRRKQHTAAPRSVYAVRGE